MKRVLLSIFGILSYCCAYAQQTGADAMLQEGNLSRVSAVAYSADGQYVFTGGGDGKCVLWNRAEAKELLSFKGHREEIKNLFPTADGRYLLTEGKHSVDSTHYTDEMYFLRWDIASGRIVSEKHANLAIQKAAFVDHGNAVIFQDEYGLVRSSFSSGIQDVRHDFRSGQWATSDDGNHLITISFVGTKAAGPVHGIVCTMYDTQSAGLLDKPVGNPVGLQDCPALWAPVVSDNLGFVAGKDADKGFETGKDYAKNIQLFSLSTGKKLIEFPVDGRLSTMRFTPDNKYFLALFESGDMTVVNTQTFDVHKFKQITHGPLALNFSPDSREVLIGEEDFQAVSISIPDGKTQKKYVGHLEPVITASFSEDGHYLIENQDWHEHVWDLETGNFLDTVPAYLRPNLRSGSSTTPDGKYELVVNRNMYTDERYRYYYTYDNYIILRDRQSKKSVFLYSFDNGGWMVLNQGAFFEVSPKAMQTLYVTKGLNILHDQPCLYFKTKPKLLFSFLHPAGTFADPVVQADKPSVNGYYIALKTGISKIEAKAISTDDPSPTLHLRITNYQQFPAGFSVIINGKQIAERQGANGDIGKYHAGDTETLEIALDPLIKKHVVNYEQDNVVEIQDFEPFGHNLSNALRFHFKLHQVEVPQLVIPTGHLREVTQLAMSDDHKTLFSAGGDGYLDTWDVESQHQLRSIRVAEGAIQLMTISSDGNYAIVGAHGPEHDFVMLLSKLYYILYDLKSGEKVDLGNHELNSGCLFTRDGKAVIFPSENKVVNIASGSESAWSVDVGGQVFYTSTGGNGISALSILDLKKNYKTVLYDNNRLSITARIPGATLGVLSADGSTYAYAANAEPYGNTELTIMNTADPNSSLKVTVKLLI